MKLSLVLGPGVTKESSGLRMVLAAVPGAAGQWYREHRKDLEHHWMEHSGCSPQQTLQCHPEPRSSVCPVFSKEEPWGDPPCLLSEAWWGARIGTCSGRCLRCSLPTRSGSILTCCQVAPVDGSGVPAGCLGLAGGDAGVTGEGCPHTGVC